MVSIGFIVVAAGLILFSLHSGRLSHTIFTPPMIFTAFGLVIGGGGLGMLDIDLGHGFVHGFAEVTLILVLFADASRIDLRAVWKDHNLPIRLLMLGLPLCIALGAVTGFLLPLGLSFWSAALLAAILAPTDAALGKSVLSNPAVPVRIRQSLNIERGLNDGIALPVVLIIAGLAGLSGAEAGEPEWLVFSLKQVVLGPVAGVVIGGLAILVERAAKTGRMAPTSQGVVILAIAFLAFAGAEIIGGNGFIAAFVAGLVFGNAVRGQCEFLFKFAEAEGQFLILITFLLFGAIILPEVLPHITWKVLGYSLLSLTLIRMVPIGLSLIGTGMRLQTTLLLGWFGPRGLASILFALFVLEEIEVAGAEQILIVTMTTVALSILAHGMTAVPFARLYGKAVERMGECEEKVAVSELPFR